MADRGRPGSGRSRGGRPRRDGDRPSFDRPRREGDRPSFDRPRREGDRPSFDRPRREGDRPSFDRPHRGDRPPTDGSRQTGRPSYDRPRRDYRPYAEGPPRHFDPPREDRPPRDGPPRDRPWEDRPRRDARPSFDRGGAGRPYQDRSRGPRPEGRREWAPRDQRRPSRPFEARPSRPSSVDPSEFVGEGDELIAGRRPVEEAFAARRAAVRLLVVPERRAALDQLVVHATTLRIPVMELEGGTLTSLAGFDGHQGVALVARPRPVADVESILAVARQRGESPFVLILDSLEDPQNFGTLMRSGEAAGVHGVVYPTHRAAPLSPAAIKAAAGATEHLLLVAADNLPGTLVDLHGRGLRIVGADEGAALTYSEADLRGPLAIVVGSEGRGISAPVRRRLDLAVRIPMRGRVGSLNAAVAGSILLFAAAQQRPDQRPPTPKEEAGSAVAAGPAPDQPGEPSDLTGGPARRRSAKSAPEPMKEEPTRPRRRTRAQTLTPNATEVQPTRPATRRRTKTSEAAGRSDLIRDDLLPGDG